MTNEKKIGRPEAFNAEYFSHYVHDSDELKIMVMKYKSDGYMAYYRLMECVSKADLHRIELKNETQKQIFLMTMGVSQEIIDFLFDLLLQTGKMNAEQWENNQTIYLDKFVRQFKKLWYDRYKSIPDANGNYIDRSPQKEKDIRVSRTGNGDSIVGIVGSNNTIESKNDPPLTISEYEELFPDKDLTSLNKYLSFDNPTHDGAVAWCKRELRDKPMIFDKLKTGPFKAWCTKCGNKRFPNNEWQLKQVSECCRAEYTNKPPMAIEVTALQLSYGCMVKKNVRLNL